MDAATFCDRISDPCERFRSRVLTGVSAVDETTIRTSYGDGFEQVKVGDFVSGERFVIMPPALFQELEDTFAKIREQGRIPILSGLDAYLGLLDRANRKSAFGFLLRYVNRTGREAVVVILRWYWPEMREVFSHPSLAGNDWIALATSAPHLRNITFVPRRFSARFAQESVPSLNEWLNWLTDGGLGGGNDIVAVKFNSGPFPGLDAAHVRQTPDARSFLGAFCSIDADRLDDAACDWILTNTETRNVAEELERRFFPGGMDLFEERALARWSRIADVMEKSVFLDFVSSHATPGGYLSRTLARAATGAMDFMRAYLRPSEDDLKASTAAALAKERENAVRKLDAGMKIEVEAAQEAFLTDAQSLSDELVAPWMDLGLDCEEREWVRRHMAGGTESVEHCRRLRAYLAKVGTGIAAVDRYMRGYRDRKAANRIDTEFCERALREEVPGAELDDRDAEIKKAAAESKTFLLVVDGLGIEWLPFIATLANEHNIQIDESRCVKTSLPTSTEFNPTKDAWGNDSRYRKFDDLDKVYHKQWLTPSEGLCMEFGEVENVLKMVSACLADYERVVLTADHGASRLAVLAYERALTETLKPGEGGIPAEIEPEKWRFARNPQGIPVNGDYLESTLSGEWVSVKGYHRLSFPGGPTFELHGGATMEERLVPWIVFKRGFTSPFKAEEAKEEAPRPSDDGQITEVSDFDL